MIATSPRLEPRWRAWERPTGPERGAPGARAGADARADTSRGRRRALLCASCRAPITDLNARAEIAGAHEHHFVNPHGYDFHIGCFARAPGLVPLGAATPHFSWFPGAPWRVARCGGCRVHLGWAYGVPVEFFGIILERLTRGEEDESS